MKQQTQEMNFNALKSGLGSLVNDYDYNTIFLSIRNLWAESFLSSEGALYLVKELKDLSNYCDEEDQFPTEADQFIFMLEGSEK